MQHDHNGRFAWQRGASVQLWLRASTPHHPTSVYRTCTTLDETPEKDPGWTRVPGKPLRLTPQRALGPPARRAADNPLHRRLGRPPLLVLPIRRRRGCPRPRPLPGLRGAKFRRPHRPTPIGHAPDGEGGARGMRLHRPPDVDEVFKRQGTTSNGTQ